MRNRSGHAVKSPMRHCDDRTRIVIAAERSWAYMEDRAAISPSGWTHPQTDPSRMNLSAGVPACTRSRKIASGHGLAGYSCWLSACTTIGALDELANVRTLATEGARLRPGCTGGGRDQGSIPPMVSISCKMQGSSTRYGCDPRGILPNPTGHPSRCRYRGISDPRVWRMIGRFVQVFYPGRFPWFKDKFLHPREFKAVYIYKGVPLTHLFRGFSTEGR
jgi:hypothetical protein